MTDSNNDIFFVSGASGVLGSRLVFDLVSKGHQVRALYRKNSNLEQVKKLYSLYSHEGNSIFNTIEWVEGDLLSPLSLQEQMTGCSKVFHCAALVSFDTHDREKLQKINIEGTSNMVNAALATGIKKFCHAGSVSSLNPVKPGFFDESNINKLPHNSSNYGISKFLSEMEVWRAGEEGLNVVIVNPTIIIGAGNWNKGSPAMIMRAWEGLSWYSMGSGGFVDVRDVSAAMIKLMESDVSGQRYLLNGTNLSYRTFYDKVHDCLGKKRPGFKAGKIISDLAWRAEKIRCIFSGKPPLITKETAAAANANRIYSNEKSMKELGINYTNIDESIRFVCDLFEKTYTH